MLDPGEIGGAAVDLTQSMLEACKNDGFVTLNSGGVEITIVIGRDVGAHRLRELCTLGYDADEQADS